MADILAYQQGIPVTVANGNRYILGDIGPGATGTYEIATRLNGGTLGYTFQCRVTGDTTWTNTLATPQSTGTPSATGTTDEVWAVDATGKDIAVLITALTGGPGFIVARPRAQFG